MDQQNTQVQQQNKRGVFVDPETLREAKRLIDDGFMFSLIIFLLAIVGAIIAKDMVAQVILFIIMIFSLLTIGATASSYNKLDKLGPKVKKIIKETIFHEDGYVEEREIKY